MRKTGCYRVPEEAWLQHFQPMPGTEPQTTLHKGNGEVITLRVEQVPVFPVFEAVLPDGARILRVVRPFDDSLEIIWEIRGPSEEEVDSRPPVVRKFRVAGCRESPGPKERKVDIIHLGRNSRHQFFEIQD